MANQKQPLRDGTGRGVGANQGRGGCQPPLGGRRGVCVPQLPSKPKVIRKIRKRK